MWINVHLPDGTRHRLEAPEGWRLMEVIRDWELPIKGECGGACACATCHVRIGDEWISRLPHPTREEIEKLDEAYGVDHRSRLACQILTSNEIDGLEVELCAESMAPKPSNLVAGQ